MREYINERVLNELLTIRYKKSIFNSILLIIYFDMFKVFKQQKYIS